MTAIKSLFLHYGDHPGTTGAHLAHASEDLGLGTGRRSTLAGPTTTSAAGRSRTPFLWVESGAPVLPDWNRAISGSHCWIRHRRSSPSLPEPGSRKPLRSCTRCAARLRTDAGRGAPERALASIGGSEAVPRHPAAADLPVSFVGRVFPGSPRETILSAVNRETPMNDWRRPHSVAEMGELYARSLLVVNPPAHGDVNMRFFEALACGALDRDPASGQWAGLARGRGSAVLPVGLRE